jgi:ribosomal protein S18 acetylase RimI-like enzyme
VNGLEVRPAESAGANWVAEFLERNHSARVASRGRLLYPATLPGFVAVRDGRPLALATYRFEDGECELATLHSEIENAGAGTALLERVADEARRAGCRRLWLITTNDNTHALRFYQRRGMTIAAIHVNAIEDSRRLKPELPLTGNDDIPIRDEIELELLLT